MILALSEFWQGYLYGAIGSVVLGPSIRRIRIPWRVRIERRDDVRL